MPIQTGSITTGLLGYTLRKEFFGDGLFYRETEVYDYEIYAIPVLPDVSGFLTIENLIKNQFSLYSGNVNVKILDSPADYFFPNDHVRLGKFNVQVEIRKPVLDLATYQPELSGNYYKGISSSFFNNYYNLLNNLQENFGFDVSENGNKIYSHDISFSLQSGGKSKASEIASSIFSNDKDTTFGISVFTGGALLADTGNYINLYSESYDLIRNSFSFSKKREVLPFDSSPYTYNLNHILNFKEDGTIDVNERGNIEGKIDFSQALQGLNELTTNSYNRCNGVYGSYKNLSAGTTVGDTLISLAIISNKVYNKPNLTIDYEIGYTNNPNIIANSSISLDKILEIERADGKYVNITQTYNYLSLVNPVHSGMDTGYYNNINLALTSSPAEVGGFYSGSSFYNSSWPTMNMIRRTATTPNRRKNYSASFLYTNNPIFFVTLSGIQYPILDYKINDTKPIDIVSEYKIINRPTKSSLVNYAYQTEKGTKTININSRLSRTSNTLTNPNQNISSNLLSLYRFGIGKLLESFVGVTVLSFTYFLSDVKYRINSDNELGLDLEVSYTIKKYLL